MKKLNLSDCKTELKELAARYRRERKENPNRVLTGHLDFWYEFMGSIMTIYGTIFLMIGLLFWIAMNENNMSQMAELLNTSQGNWKLINVLLPFVMILYTVKWFIAIIREYRSNLGIPVAAIFVCYTINGLLLRNGILVFTLKGTVAVFLGSAIIKFLLITVMDIAGLPSRNITVVRCSDNNLMCLGRRQDTEGTD